MHSSSDLSSVTSVVWSRRGMPSRVLGVAQRVLQIMPGHRGFVKWSRGHVTEGSIGRAIPEVEFLRPDLSEEQEYTSRAENSSPFPSLPLSTTASPSSSGPRI